MRTSNTDEPPGAQLDHPAQQDNCERWPPIAVTLGDPEGIGPDVTLMSWAKRAELGLPSFVVFGEPEVLRNRARRLGLDVPLSIIADLAVVAEVFDGALPVVPVGGDGAATAGSLIVASIEAAVAAAAQGRALGLVTNPITKSALNHANLPYPGHTAFLAVQAERYGDGKRPRPVMMLVADELRVVPTTVHIPIAAVAGSLTQPLLRETIDITRAALKNDFGIARPRIAVSGLNPHAGEGGLIGSEEQEVIIPVIEAMAASGMAVTGPHAADTLFHSEVRRTYDAVVAIYHDQALIPLKTLAFDRGVNITLGLPFVRTSPDHGTAFDVAGTGNARPGSFIAALRLAFDVGRRRASKLRSQVHAR